MSTVVAVHGTMERVVPCHLVRGVSTGRFAGALTEYFHVNFKVDST